MPKESSVGQPHARGRGWRRSSHSRPWVGKMRDDRVDDFGNFDDGRGGDLRVVVPKKKGGRNLDYGFFTHGGREGRFLFVSFNLLPYLSQFLSTRLSEASEVLLREESWMWASRQIWKRWGKKGRATWCANREVAYNFCVLSRLRFRARDVRRMKAPPFLVGSLFLKSERRPTTSTYSFRLGNCSRFLSKRLSEQFVPSFFCFKILLSTEDSKSDWQEKKWWEAKILHKYISSSDIMKCSMYSTAMANKNPSSVQMQILS